MIGSPLRLERVKATSMAAKRKKRWAIRKNVEEEKEEVGKGTRKRKKIKEQDFVYVWLYEETFSRI